MRINSWFRCSKCRFEADLDCQRSDDFDARVGRHGQHATLAPIASQQGGRKRARRLQVAPVPTQ
jgi:hypothetical protein